MLELFKSLFEKYDEGDGSEIVLNMIFAGCTSTETLTTRESFEESKNVLSAMKDAIAVADVGDKTKEDWSNRIDGGLQLLNLR